MPLPLPPLCQFGQLKMSPDIAKYVLGSKRDLGSKLLASQHPASWLWAPPLPLSALQFIPAYMLRLAAAECVSELDEIRHEWMEAWMDG